MRRWRRYQRLAAAAASPAPSAAAASAAACADAPGVGSGARGGQDSAAGAVAADAPPPSKLRRLHAGAAGACASGERGAAACEVHDTVGAVCVGPTGASELLSPLLCCDSVSTHRPRSEWHDRPCACLEVPASPCDTSSVISL